MRHADANAYGFAYCNVYSDSYGYSYCDRHSNGYGNDSASNADGYSNGYSYGHANGDSVGNGLAEGYPDAEAASDTAASPIVGRANVELLGRELASEPREFSALRGRAKGWIGFSLGAP